MSAEARCAEIAHNLSFEISKKFSGRAGQRAWARIALGEVGIGESVRVDYIRICCGARLKLHVPRGL